MDTRDQTQPTESSSSILADVPEEEEINKRGGSPDIRRRGWHRDILLGPVAILIFLVDQATKTFVRENVGLGQSFPPDGFFRVTHVINTGSAFGLFSNQTPLLIIASIIGISVLIYFYRRQPKPSFLLRFSLGLQLGGAFSNLIDRVALGYVVDFIDVGPWPIFNLADSSISIGIFLLLWVVLNNNDQKETRYHPDHLKPDD